MIATLIEVWETTLAVLLLIIISGGIIMVYSPDLIHAKTLNNEISYIASIKGNKDYQITLDLKKPDEINLVNNKKQNEIKLTVDSKSTIKKYIGNNTNIEKNGNQIIIS